MSRFLPAILSVGFALLAGGVVIAQTVFGIEVPIIGRFFGGGRGGSSGPSAKAEFKKLGISYEKADPNEIIDKLERRAKKWRKDAKFYSMHINELQQDGTLDFSTKKPTMTVEFFSPSLVGSSSSTKYKKGIRKFVINYVKIDEQVWGTKKSYPDVPGTPIPKCKMSKLAKSLKDKGLTKDSRLSVGLDPGFAFATKGLSLNVNGTKPKLHVFADIHSCEVIKEL
jgi:hypothetical protein